MTKTYSFNYILNNTPKTTTFRTSKPADYSAMLDGIIATDIAKKNGYLYDTEKASNLDAILKSNSTIILGDLLKKNEKFYKAANFLANYKTGKNKLPYTIGKIYHLADGTPIIFYDDEIQIGFDLYNYSDFKNNKFLIDLDDTTKKTIINLYINIA